MSVINAGTRVPPPDGRSQTGMQPATRLSRVFERLGAAEIRRRICHIGPGFLPFLLWPISHRDPLSPTLLTILVCITAGLGIAVFAQYRHIKRRGESNERLAACAGYAGSVLAMALLFPAHLELAMMVLAVMAFGDGFATVGGLLIGGKRLPWNPTKTVAGSACFLLVGTPMASLVYWGEAQNLEALPQLVPVTLGIASACGFATTLAAAFAESLQSRINDNLRVGVTAALTAVWVQGLIVGWI